jgi:hypothetical protein
MASKNGIEPDGYPIATVYLHAECRAVDCDENKKGWGGYEGELASNQCVGLDKFYAQVAHIKIWFLISVHVKQ